MFFRERGASSVFALCVFFQLTTVLGQPAGKNASNNASVLETLINHYFQEATVEEVLSTISQKYKVKFTYVNNEIPLDRRVTLALVNQPLHKVLDKIFKDFGIIYQEIGTQILLKKKDQNPSLSPPPSSNQKTKLSTAYIRKDTSNQRVSTASKRKGFSLRDLFSSNPKQPKSGALSFREPRYNDSTNQTSDSLRKKNNSDREFGQKRASLLPSQYPAWSLGIFVAPERTYRSVHGNGVGVSERNAFERGKLGFSIGGFVRCQMSRHLFVQSGVSYLQFGEKGSYSAQKHYLPPSDEMPNSFRTDTSVSYTNKYGFLGIPLLVGYSFGTKWSFSVQTGMIFSIFLYQKTDYPSGAPISATYPEDYIPNPAVKPVPPELPERRRSQTTTIITIPYYYRNYLDPRSHEMSSFGLIYSASVELGYRFSDRIKVSAFPVFKYFLTSVYVSDEEMKQRPYSIGLSFGALYSF